MYDPNIPADHADLTGAMFRGQFNGLKDLIDALQTITGAVVDGVNTVPAGDPAAVDLSVVDGVLHFSFSIPQGVDGSNGTPFAAAVVDEVNTLPSGEPATVESSFDGSTVHLTFGIPAGADGGDGADGPPVAGVVVDGVNTLPAGEPATVESTFDGSTVHLTFGIPAGADGSSGSDGADGGEGPPGEVSLAQLDDAIASTSANSNAVETLDTPFANDPPTLADLEIMRAKMNELINALRR
jgi:hypothetical protein